MKLEYLIKRADELIKLAHGVLSTQRESQMGRYVEVSSFGEMRTAGLSFIARTFGNDSPQYKEFDVSVKGPAAHYSERAMGILKACRNEIAGGWLFTTKGLVSAEVFGDFISMAEHLLKEGYKDPAAVMVGSVLEEHLRQLCQKNSIPI